MALLARDARISSPYFLIRLLSFPVQCPVVFVIHLVRLWSRHSDLESIMRTLGLLLSAALLSACAYNAPVDVSPAYNVYSNYEDKLPGRYALYVDSAEAKGEGEVKGFACSAHSYPYDGEAPFSSSVVATFRNIVEEVELVAMPMDAAALSAGGY